jgi:shikimate 5-dehydrogenase
LRSARNSGLPAANGIGMLVRQAVLAFRAWTGQEPPWEVMYQAVAAQA